MRLWPSAASLGKGQLPRAAAASAQPNAPLVSGSLCDPSISTCPCATCSSLPSSPLPGRQARVPQVQDHELHPETPWVKRRG